MNKIDSSDKFKLAGHIEGLRSDQRGSLTLLAGMMVFLVTIFSIIAFDTNMAIYRRIVAQNAVDAAADSAALWQARGCNMLQQLNNLHYDVDTAACIAEGVAAGACIASDALLAAELVADAFFGAGEALRPIRIGTCFVCDTLPWIDYGQQLFYKAIMPVEQAIVDITPFLAFGYANACAYGSGANNVFDSALQTIEEAASLIPGVGDLSGSGVSSAIGNVLGDIPIYAMPLDPTSLELYVDKKDNDGSPPLKWPEGVGIAGEAAGDIGCEDAEPAPPYPESQESAQEAGWDGDGTWGWNDQYYFGHPGYMTWIAGVTNRDELLHLGNLAWLNGGMKNSGYQQNGEQVSKLMWTGPANGNSGGYSKFQIPAYIAIASSQIEGTPVICHGDVDAQGKLIKVYLPDKTPGDDFLIYH